MSSKKKNIIDGEVHVNNHSTMITIHRKGNEKVFLLLSSVNYNKYPPTIFTFSTKEEYMAFGGWENEWDRINSLPVDGKHYSLKNFRQCPHVVEGDEPQGGITYIRLA